MPRKISVAVGQPVVNEIPLEMNTNLHSLVSALIEKYPFISVVEGVQSKQRQDFLKAVGQLPAQAESFANGYAVKLKTMEDWTPKVNETVCSKVYEIANALDIKVHYLNDGVVVEDSKWYVEK